MTYSNNTINPIYVTENYRINYLNFSIIIITTIHCLYHFIFILFIYFCLFGLAGGVELEIKKKNLNKRKKNGIIKNITCRG